MRSYAASRVLGEAEKLSLAHDRASRRRWPWIGSNETKRHVGVRGQNSIRPAAVGLLPPHTTRTDDQKSAASSSCL